MNKLKEKPRKGWAKAFKEMHKAGDDELLINDVFEDETLEFIKLKSAKKLSNKLL
jgi:antitoxin MazE